MQVRGGGRGTKAIYQSGKTGRPGPATFDWARSTMDGIDVPLAALAPVNAILFG